jgi:chaperone required for assembly of F1-ATPase
VQAGARRLSVQPGVPLHLPTRALADALAEEWQRVGPKARPTDLRLASLAMATAEATALRHPVEDVVLAYADTDLVSYWSADDAPLELRARQAAAWQPMLDWIATTYDAPLRVNRGIVPAAQAPATLAKLRAAVAALPPAELIALRVASAAAGSLVIGLGLIRGAWGVDAAHAAATVDETYQLERWGTDAEAVAGLAARRNDLADAVRFVTLWRGP